jgi:hypothetical protein
MVDGLVRAVAQLYFSGQTDDTGRTARLERQA